MKSLPVETAATAERAAVADGERMGALTEETIPPVLQEQGGKLSSR